MILIVDDHAIVRRGLAHVVKEGFPDADVVEADGASAALEVMRIQVADLALVDVRMPGFDGLELLRAMKLEWPNVPVIMLSTYENPEYVRRALSDGAVGYLLKDATPEELVAAVRVVAAGDALLAPSVTRRLIEDFARSAPPPRTSETRLAGLTEREREVLVLVGRGMSNAEIASALFIAEQTVKTHVSKILQKLGLRDRVHAVVLAYDTGLVTPGA